eukprot:jgi/Mesvir1/10834/Mv03538-RA.1
MEELTGLARRLRSAPAVPVMPVSRAMPAPAPSPTPRVPVVARLDPAADYDAGSVHDSPSPEQSFGGSSAYSEPPPAHAVKSAAVVRADVPARPKGAPFVLPAIAGVASAIGVIHLGPRAFPKLFKDEKGAVNKNKANLGGVAFGVVVFFLARYFLS